MLIAVKPLTLAAQPRAQAIASELRLPLYQAKQDYDFLLLVTTEHLALQQLGEQVPGPLQIDFLAGKLGYRLQNKGQKELLAKAIGFKKTEQLSVLDATAGLGRDGFLLASLGCDVLMLERSLIIGSLLQDGLARALKAPAYAQLKIKLKVVEAKNYLENLNENFPDVIYLDPMYPQREKSALVKKEMQYLQALLGKDETADNLLSLALTKAKKRVVVKRSKIAECLANRKPDFVVSGKNTRFDVYLPLTQPIS